MDETTTMMEESTSTKISGYKPFEYECDYCGETHEGLLGIFVTLYHTILSGFELLKKSIGQ